MIQFEFEQLAGYKVSIDDFETIINPMYLSTSLSKKAFVECLDRNRFDVKRRINGIVKEMKAMCKSFRLNGVEEDKVNLMSRLKRLSRTYIDLKYPYEGFVPVIIGGFCPEELHIINTKGKAFEIMNLID